MQENFGLIFRTLQLQVKKKYPNLKVPEFPDPSRFETLGTPSSAFSQSPTQRTLPYQKYYAIVNLLCVVNLLSHTDLLWPPPCADTIFLGFSGAFPLKEGFRA